MAPGVSAFPICRKLSIQRRWIHLLHFLRMLHRHERHLDGHKAYSFALSVTELWQGALGN